MSRTEEKAVTSEMASAIQRQITRLEKLSTKLNEFPERMRSRLAMVMVILDRPQPAGPPSANDPDASELALVLDAIACRLENALDGCTHVLNEVDL